MRRFQYLLCFLFVFTGELTFGQTSITDKGNYFLQEYLAGIQSGVDVTPLVIGIKDMYASADVKGRKELKELIIDFLSERLSNNQQSQARSLVNVYQLIAEADDEKLPMLYYILGNMYAEQQDSINLKNTISSLEKCATNSPESSDYLQSLNGYLEKMRNYVPPTYNIVGDWVTDVTENSPSAYIFCGMNLPKYLISAELKDGRIKYKISGASIDYNNNKRFFGFPFFNNDGEESYSQIEKEYGSDSLYIFWSSEILSNSDLQEIARRHYLVGDFATGVATGISNGQTDFGSRVAGRMAGAMLEVGVNALLDNLFTPSKRIAIVEAWLKRVNNNLFEGTISWKETKVKAGNHNIKFDETVDHLLLMRWPKKSGVVFLEWYGNPYAPFVSFSKNKAKRFGMIYYKDLRKDINSEFGQAYRQYKDSPSAEKRSVILEYNQRQIDKLRNQCITTP